MQCHLVPSSYDLILFKPKKIDIIVCLGGDGTLLYASSLFNDSVPPIMSFNLGSLGFLTPYNFENFKANMESLFHGNMEVIMRSRLRANVRDLDSEELLQAPQLALNEVTIDRGPSHYICNLGTISLVEVSVDFSH